MAVYTALNEADLTDLLARYDVGELVSFTGIQDGVENSNFFVTTTAETYVVTVFEKHPPEEVPYFLYLTAHLAAQGVPCAAPIADEQGGFLQTVRGKPTALIERLPGRTLTTPEPGHCTAVGRAMAQMHVAAASFDRHHANERGPRWWLATARKLRELLDADDRAVLDAECEHQRAQREVELPSGTIHADLFRDNVLFDSDRLAGMIDFNYACDDCLLYDVAVAVNDWCGDAAGRLDPERTRALLEAYHAVRPFTADEARHWSTMLRAGALRFWLSRLLDLHYPRPAEVPHVKDPDEYRRVLHARRTEAPVMGPLGAVA